MLFIHLTDGTKLPVSKEGRDAIMESIQKSGRTHADGIMFIYRDSLIAMRHVVGFIDTNDTDAEKPIRKILPCGGYLFLSRNGKHKHILSLPDHPHDVENCPAPN